MLSWTSLHRFSVALGVFTLLFYNACLFAQSDAGNSSDAKFDIAEDEKPFWESAQKFVDAYANRDADAIGEMFTEDADFLDELGVRTQGREAIVTRFQEAFNNSPDALIDAIDIVNVKHLGENVVLEEGYVTSSESATHARTSHKYAAIHQKGEDGKWRIAVLKDFPREESGRTEQLNQLAWMIGEWVNESSDTIVETTCDWSEDGNYLLRKFVVKTADGRSMSGTQRIGWDPVHKKLRSWTFDSEGGFFNGLWTRSEQGWILTSAGVSSEGETVTATAIYQPVNSEKVFWQYQSLIVGDEIHAQQDPVIMVRKSPAPALNVSQKNE